MRCWSASSEKPSTRRTCSVTSSATARTRSQSSSAFDGRIAGTALHADRGVSLDDDARVMLNPGSVGQPRDGDPRASFMVVDLDAARAVVRRVEYDIQATQRKIRAAGLP